MFNYFRNCSSNAHKGYCEDSPTKGLYDYCQSDDDLDLHSRSQVRLSLEYVLACTISDNYLSYDIQTWHDGILLDAILKNIFSARLVSITLTLMQGHSGSAKENNKNQRWLLSETNQAIGIQLATTVGLFFFLRDSDFGNVYIIIIIMNILGA